MESAAEKLENGLDKEKLLESILGYCFQDPALRKRAITRRSYVNDRGPGSMHEQEALATLGDSVIGLIVLTRLVSKYDDEGVITAKKSEMVNHVRLSEAANKIGLKQCLLLGKCEGNNKEWNEGKALGECLESIIGAIYLDSYNNHEDGVNNCEKVLEKVLFSIPG